MRGGTAHCDVILSRGEIGSPMVDQPDVLIAMNTPSLLRFQSRLKPDGLIIYDSSLVTESPETPYADCLSVPASQMASELGEPKTANLIILGALIKKVPFLTPAAIYLAIDEIVRSDKLRRLNREALELGRNYG
jgi:Pyruvate/2-oxoacid:ferredoxin oxidoreductase gamma subunit